MSFALAVWLLAAGQVVDAPEMGEAERQRQAKLLLDEGLKRYEAKDYERAVESFKAAYALAPAPGLLFNIGQAYRLWGRGHCGDASRTYRTYLQASPQAANREKVESFIKSLEGCARDEEPASVAAAPPAAEPAPRPVELAPQPVRSPAPSATGSTGVETARRRPFRWAQLTTVLGGAAVLGVGAGLYGWAGEDYKSYVLKCSGGTCAPSVWQASQLKEQVGIAMLGFGAAVMLAAAIWWLVVAGGES